MNVPGGRVLLPRQAHRAIAERRRLAGLTMTLGACNIFLGVDAFSAACVLGILGGPAICAVLIIARRNHHLALGFVAIGALPFAIATWWSVVTPLTRHLPWWPAAAVSPSTLSQHP
jgi:hypothetical protein